MIQEKGRVEYGIRWQYYDETGIIQAIDLWSIVCICGHLSKSILAHFGNKKCHNIKWFCASVPVSVNPSYVRFFVSIGVEIESVRFCGSMTSKLIYLKRVSGIILSYEENIH